MSKQNYKQVPAKVTRYVDENIKDLIELLNMFDGIQTLESFGGREGYLTEINIDCGTNYDIDSPDFLKYSAHKMADVAQFFNDIFKMYLVGSSNGQPNPFIKMFEGTEGIDISIHWEIDPYVVNPLPSPIVKLEFPCEYIEAITTALRCFLLFPCT
ncbi:MAG: hypothetical protein ABSG90_07920 [Dehalococcoidia bacterium]|jgi:hypothetical protein